MVPLSSVAMADNCSPFLTIVLAFFILSEYTNCFQLTATVIAVIGASMVVLGGQ